MVEASPIWGALAFLVMLLLTALSVPIAASMGFVGLVLVILFYGDFSSLQFVAANSWGNVALYDMSVFPLFIFMGNLISKSDLGRDAFDGINRLMGRTRGGLAMVSTMTCALFGSVSGSSMSTIVAIGGVALPQMKRYGYSNMLRTGSVSTSGCIANLIPPSMAAVLFSVVTEVSLGKLFIAGIIPGLILTFLILGTIYIWALVRPEDAPRSNETFTLKEKLEGLKAPLPILMIFLFLMVGIYQGLFSPAEGAGMGVFFTIVMMVVLGKFTWGRFYDALRDTIKMTSMIFAILMAAVMFSSTIALSQLPQFIADWSLETVESPLAILYLVILIFIIAGCILENFGMVMMLVPLFYPVITQAGFDGIFFGVIIIMMMEMSMLTPPIGNNIYVTSYVDGEATYMDVTIGTIPFYVAVMGLTVLIIHFPMIAMWLPSTM